MAADFSTLEARVNASVVRRLANREASFVQKGGGTARPLKGIFDDEYVVVMDGMAAGSTPAFIVISGDLPAQPGGGTLTINGTTYSVVEPMPDGTGLIALRLRKTTS